MRKKIRGYFVFLFSAGVCICFKLIRATTTWQVGKKNVETG